MATPEEFQGSSTGGVHILNGIAQFLISCLASSNNCLIYIFRLRPRPHVYVFMRKRRFFCSFSPSVHTQTLIQRFRKSPFSPETETFENGFESGDFRKRCVVVWTGENGDFWKRCWFENAYLWTWPQRQRVHWSNLCYYITTLKPIIYSYHCRYKLSDVSN